MRRATSPSVSPGEGGSPRLAVAPPEEEASHSSEDVAAAGRTAAAAAAAPSATYGDGDEFPMLILDAATWTVTHANAALAALAGYPRRRDLVGKPLDGLVSGARASASGLLRADGSAVEVELSLLRACACMVRNVHVWLGMYMQGGASLPARRRG